MLTSNNYSKIILNTLCGILAKQSCLLLFSLVGEGVFNLYVQKCSADTQTAGSRCFGCLWQELNAS
jgi:hypothetical protein